MKWGSCKTNNETKNGFHWTSGMWCFSEVNQISGDQKYQKQCREERNHLTMQYAEKSEKISRMVPPWGKDMVSPTVAGISLLVLCLWGLDISKRDIIIYKLYKHHITVGFGDSTNPESQRPQERTFRQCGGKGLREQVIQISQDQLFSLLLNEAGEV